jgi:hypothetical protein
MKISHEKVNQRTTPRTGSFGELRSAAGDPHQRQLGCPWYEVRAAEQQRHRMPQKPKSMVSSGMECLKIVLSLKILLTAAKLGLDFGRYSFLLTLILGAWYDGG